MLIEEFHADRRTQLQNSFIKSAFQCIGENACQVDEFKDNFQDRKKNQKMNSMIILIYYLFFVSHKCNKLNNVNVSLSVYFNQAAMSRQKKGISCEGS